MVSRIWASARMVQLEGWFRSSVLDSVYSSGGGRGSVEALYQCVADVIKSFDTVDRVILDRIFSSMGLLAWFRHAFFEYHAHVRLRFKLAAGLGEPWTRDGAFFRDAR